MFLIQWSDIIQEKHKLLNFKMGNSNSNPKHNSNVKENDY